MTHERETPAYIRDDTTAGVRSIFVRLVPLGTVMPADTWTVPECHADFDGDGQLIGVNLFIFPGKQPADVAAKDAVNQALTQQLVAALAAQPEDPAA